MGVSGSVPGPSSPASCYLVEADTVVAAGDGIDGEPRRTWRVVLDLGSGAFGPLQRFAGVETLDAVALSHLHADHCLDVTALHVAAHHGPLREVVASRGLPVWGPAGVRERISRAHDAEPGRPEDLPGPLAFHEWVAGEAVGVGPLTLTPVPVHHPVPAFGIAVVGPSESGGRSVTLAYTGDTDAGPGLDALASGADVLLCEATALSVGAGGPDLSGIHLSGRGAGETAARAGVERLVLTHVPPWADAAAILAEARDAAGDACAVSLAVPGEVITL